MPRLTVVMPVCDTARYVRQAMESVLAQQGVDFELLVIDDASTDDSAAIVASFDDPRVRVLRNRSRLGISACANLARRESDAPLLSHVDSDDFLLPGALARMVAEMESSPRVGQAFCRFFPVDEQGRVSRPAWRRQVAWLGPDDPPTRTFEDLLAPGAVINHLRTYRRAALDDVGPFNEDLGIGGDLEMALRLALRYELRLVPEHLYCWRRHRTSSTGRLALRELRWGLSRARYLRAIVASLPEGPERRRAHAAVEAHLASRPPAWRHLRSLAARGRLGRVVRGARRTAARCVDEARITAQRAARRAADLALGRLPLGPLPAPTRPPRRLGVVLWSYPVLSQTFVRRELSALRAAGLTVVVLAWESDPDAAGGVADDVPVHRLKRRLKPMPLRRLLIRRPLAVVSAVAFALFHRDLVGGGWRRRRRLARQVLNVAVAVQELALDHLHCPWADDTATVALIAGRAAGVPYSVRPRAFDLHADRQARGRPRRLARASVVITDCRFNAETLAPLLGSRRDRLHVVPTGLDLDALVPPARARGSPGALRVVTVARLTEQKGLPILLDACARLVADGVDLELEIVGGPERPRSTNHWIELLRRRRALGLERRVTLRGPQPFAEVVAALGRGEVFALPCVVASDGRRDVMPTAVMEAMACGLPVVSTRLSGIPELVADGETGLLVPPGDVDAFAAALRRLADDPDLRARLGAAGRARAQARFDIADTTAGLLAAILG